MKFPRHWALGRVGAGLAWGWSDVSREAAQAEADRRARSLDERLRGSRRPDPQDGYYPGRPIREELLREFGRSGDDLFAAVAEDRDGIPVFLARNSWDLQRTAQDNPAIRFGATRERA